MGGAEEDFYEEIGPLLHRGLTLQSDLASWSYLSGRVVRGQDLAPLEPLLIQ